MLKIIAILFLISSNSFAGKLEKRKCNAPVGEKVFNSRVERYTKNQLDIFDFSYNDEISFLNPFPSLANNIYFHGCSDILPEGIKTMSENIQVSFNEGFSCMDRISKIGAKAANEYRSDLGNDQAEKIISRSNQIREISKRMMGNFIEGVNRPFGFRCSRQGYEDSGRGPLKNLKNYTSFGLPVGHYGQAYGCDENSKSSKFAPLIVLDTNHLNSSSAWRIQQLIFHELIHHGGISHSNTARFDDDWVYKIASCCFGPMSNQQDLFKNTKCIEIFESDHNKRPDSSYDKALGARVLGSTSL